MEHVRLSLVTIDPAQLDDLVALIEGGSRPRVEAEPGNRGMSLSVDRELGVAVVASYWVSGDAMRETEKLEATLREDLLRSGTATVSIEHYEVSSAQRQVRPRAGAGVRLTRAEVDPRRAADAIAAWEDTAVPWLTAADGFCSGLLFVHRPSGRAVNETVWRDTDALAASRGAAAAIRVETVAATGAVVQALQELAMVSSSSPAG